MLVASRLTTSAFTNETPGITGSMAFDADEEQGLIRPVSSGFWSVRQIRDFFTAYNACVARIHQRGLKVVSICDLREAQAQSQAVTDILSSSIAGVYRPGDRVAMVVANSLVKIQMRRILDSAYHEFFLSMSAGETWALAHRRAH